MSVQKLRLFLSYQIGNSQGSLCKSTTKIIFHYTFASIFRLDNQQDGKRCFTNICCWAWKRRGNTVQDKTGYDCKHLTQNFITGIVEKSLLTVLLLISSMNFSCAVLGTFSTSTLNGLEPWQMQIGCQADLENMKFHLQA